MEHLDLAGVVASTPMNWNLPLFDQQDAIYLSSSRQMLEPILEETSEDEEHAQNSWSPYEQTASTSFWSGSASASASESETGSVIRIDVNKDSDSISERDFACPPKRPRRSDEFLREQLTVPSSPYFPNQTQSCSLDDTVILRKSHPPRPEYISESSMSSLDRFLAFEAAARDSLQRSSIGSTRRFDDFCIDPDTISYQSLSRSSSLIQFESLERQLQLQDQHASMSSLGNSSPSVLSFDGGLNAGSNSGSNSGNNSRRGSQSSLLKQRYESSDGRLHQTYYDLDKLNFDDDDSSITPSHKQRIMLFSGSGKTLDSTSEMTTGEAKSDSESSSSSSGSGNSVLNSTKPSAEDLSDAAVSGKSLRIVAYQRGGKNSAENLSEDSGYCEPSNLRRSKSKSIPKNFEKFCEEEEEYGQFGFEHEHTDSQLSAMLHSNSKTNRSVDKYRDQDCVDNNDDDGDHEDNGRDDMCQPKINDTTFTIMESSNATDRSKTVILPQPPFPRPLETSFDAFMYTIPPATVSARVKNSPTRDTTTSAEANSTATATTTTAMSVNIERSHRSIAHSPSPVASDISARSSTSTTPSTCASAASFTWYTPTQLQCPEPPSTQESPLEGREFSSLSFTLRNSLPDLREPYGSISENSLFFSNPQGPTNGDVLDQSLKPRGEETGETFSEAAVSIFGGRGKFVENRQRRTDSSTTPSSSPTTTSEHSDVTTDSPTTTPESTRRRRSVGVCGVAEVIEGSGACAYSSKTPYKKRVSSVPSELHKIGRKKRKSQRHSRHYRSSSDEVPSSSSETNSECEDNFNVDLNALRRCCSWSERRQKSKRCPTSVFGYMNASYQDLTQLDYTSETKQNQALLKRANDKMSDSRPDSSLPDYQPLICKGNFLLDELSELYDRNVSILTDRPYDVIPDYGSKLEDDALLEAQMNQKPLHSPRPPPRRRNHSQSSVSDVESVNEQDVQHVQLTIRKPPARRRNRGNTGSLTSEPTEIPGFPKTFDQDPTNLRTSYAQSLEKCNFDPKELSNSDLTAQQQSRSMPKRRFHSQANSSKKKNLVSSTPNLNTCDRGGNDENELEDEIFVSSAHTSMHQLPQGGVPAQKPLGILLPAGSRTSFSKEVSFCPVVSKYSWQEQSSEECNDPAATSPSNEFDESNEQGDQMLFSSVLKEKKHIKEKRGENTLNNNNNNNNNNDDDDDFDDDDLLCNDIDATLAYNTKENETIAAKKIPKERNERKESDFSTDRERNICERFMEDLREHGFGEETEKSNNQVCPTIQAPDQPTIVTSTKLVTSDGVEKTTTRIITKRYVPSTSGGGETLTIVDATTDPVGSDEVSHKTTFVSTTSSQSDSKSHEIKEDVSVANAKSTTGQTPRPLSIQLPILSEPPVNRAHHILYASQQMLDNFQKREREAELQEQQERRLKAASANNLSGVSAISGVSGTMSRQTVSMDAQNSMNNNNDLNKMKSKFKADEKHPNSKGFLSRFAHGLRFSLRRNKKKQLQKDQQQQMQSQPEFVPELQFNVVKETNKKEKEPKNKNKTSKSSSTSKGSTTTTTVTITKSAGKSGKSPDTIHIPLKGPLPAGSRSSPNTTVDSSTANSSMLNSSNVSNASTVNVEQSVQNGATVLTPTVDTKPTTMKLVTGKPPLPKQPPPRTSSLPQNAGHAHHLHYQQQQQQQAPAVAITTSFVSKSLQPTIGLPIQGPSDSCEDFLAAERSYYYDDFKNQLNSGMQANGCTLGSAPNGGPDVSSPSRASVSQKTQMFNNMHRTTGTAPVSQQRNAGKIGLIETNLDTHETIITGKTRSLVDIGPSQLKFVNASGKRLNLTSTGAGGNNVLIYDDDDDDIDGEVVDVMDVHGGGNVVVVKTTTPAGQIASVRRPHKSMEFLLDKENQKNVLPPENELQKSHEQNPAALSEHQLRIQASLQRLNIPDWFRQYNQTQAHSPESGGVGSSTYKPGNFTRKRTQESGRWAGLNSKTTSLSSLGSQRSDRSPLLLSPSAHSHHGGQTTLAGSHQAHATSVYSTAGTGSSGGAFSRWSTSHLNSSQTSPSVSQRGSFSRGGPINSSFMSVASSGNNSSIIRNSFRQPYLGWRSTEKLSQRTAHERLASSMLAQQQRTSPTAPNGSIAGLNNKLQQPVTPEIQSSIKEVTSAIVHYVNDQTNQQRSRSTSPNSRKCWLESSFVGIRPLDSPQTPVIEAAGSTAFNVGASNNLVVNNSNSFSYNNPTITTTIPSTYLHNTTGISNTVGTTASPSIGLTTNAANVLRMNGLSLSGGAPERSLSSASLEDVLASLLGLPQTSGAGAGLSTSDPYARSTTGDIVSEKSNVSYRHMPQQQLQQQQLQINKQIDQRLRRCSEGDTPNSQKQQQQQQQLEQQNANKSNPTSGTATFINTTTGENSNVLQPRRVSLGDSSESNNNKTNTSSELQIRCRNTKCEHSATPADAKKYYKSCHNCTHLYCSRECRRAHWEKHRKACLHSRASNLCRQVLATCKDDVDSQRHLSLLARKGFLSQGRGVVRVLFRSAEAAEGFIKHGFQCMGEASFVRWPDLMPAEMGLELYAELLKLSTEYKPDSKMLIYVAICVVSEAPGMGQAPVRWERQLVSRCAKLKLCKTILLELEQQQQALQQQPLAVVAVPEPTTEILILTFNPNLRSSTTHRELILSNILDILSRRGVLLRKHYPEIYQRLQSYTEGQTDKFNPVTLHPRDSQTGQSFVCIIMPVHSESEIIKLPSAADGGNRVTTIDVGSPAALAQLDDDELLTRSTS